MADKSLRLVVDTQELSPESMAAVMTLYGQFGWFVFKMTEIKDEDIPTETPEFKEQLTLDERLNKTLYKYHILKTNDSKSYHTFRRDVYERLLKVYQDKITEMDQIEP